MHRKGIILAGGTGSRLSPITTALSKQLLPVYDKPMVYYPLSVLMLAGVTQIAIITTPDDQFLYKKLLGDGSKWGLIFEYLVQERPEGIAQAYILAEKFLDGAPSALILGDNIFFGHGLPDLLNDASFKEKGGTIFGYHVNDPERYGIIEFDTANGVTSLEEKPTNPKSKYAITGLYFLDDEAPSFAKKVKKSNRGEYEMIDVLNYYRSDGNLDAIKMSRGYAWFDTGTCSSLLDASNYVRTLTERQGLQVGSPDEVAFQKGLIDGQQLLQLSKQYGNNQYSQYLESLSNTHDR